MPTALSGDELRDPFQGFDIAVKVTEVAAGGAGGATATPVLDGVFTGFMARITCHTEAYLPLGQRTPRMLDGELVVVWSLEQAMVSSQVMKNTYGEKMAKAYAGGRGETPVPRQRRFNIGMSAGVLATTGPALDESEFNAGTSSTSIGTLKLDLIYARVDTGSFGVMAGKRMASSSWQGTAEYCTATKTA
jgi:hypothetical protein